jgi:hypothetical protein
MIRLCDLCVLCGEKFKKGFYNILYNEKSNLHLVILNPLDQSFCFLKVLPKEIITAPPFETGSQPMFVIASDRRERGNLIIFNTLLD